ncbi:hypothetical protein cand_020740 [Cryptosporidium andersoni]|uniref:peptidyl-tRNA hydrolase n=1 Tax=Cryptosporidium andersoni TaxID=117008 RepID=A0A1J4MVR6_9CRYT|nr:hypothetical protein cand_020740 [Cryptosporidium andersoni]
MKVHKNTGEVIDRIKLRSNQCINSFHLYIHPASNPPTEPLEGSSSTLPISTPPYILCTVLISSRIRGSLKYRTVLNFYLIYNSTEMSSAADPIVQYILVRTDLNWNRGSITAQACHASVAAIVENITMPTVQSYIQDINNMHKVVLCTDSSESLIKLSNLLKESGIIHKLWNEQPEDIPTCIATMFIY